MLLLAFSSHVDEYLSLFGQSSMDNYLQLSNWTSFMYFNIFIYIDIFFLLGPLRISVFVSVGVTLTK